MYRYFIYISMLFTFAGNLRSQGLYPTFQHITRANHLPPEEIRILLPHGPYVLIGTDKKILVFDGEKVSELMYPAGKKTTMVSSMLADRNGNIWIGTHNGLFIYTREETLVTIDSVGNYAVNYIQVVLQDNEGNIWFLSGAQNNLLVAYNPVHQSFENLGNKYELIQASTLPDDGSPILWYRENNAVYRLSYDQHSRVPLKKKFVFPGVVYEIQTDEKHRAVIATDHGIYSIEGEQVTCYFPDEKVTSVTPYKGYWICTLPGKGVLVLFERSGQVYCQWIETPHDEGSLSGNDVSFCRVFDHRLYIAHTSPRIDFCNLDNSTFRIIRNPAVKGGFKDVARYDSTPCFLGNDSTLYRWQDEHLETLDESVKATRIYSLHDTLYCQDGNRVIRLPDHRIFITPDNQPVQSVTPWGNTLYVNTLQGNNYTLDKNGFKKIEGFTSEVYRRFTFLIPLDSNELLVNAHYSYLMRVKKGLQGYERTHLVHLVEKTNQVVRFQNHLIILTDEGIHYFDEKKNTLVTLIHSGDEIFRRIAVVNSTELLLVCEREIKKIQVVNGSCRIVKQWYNIPVEQLEDKNVCADGNTLWLPHSTGILRMDHSSSYPVGYVLNISHIKTGGHLFANLWAPDTIRTRYRDHEISMDVSVSSANPEEGIHLKYFLNKTDSGVTVDERTTTIYFKNLKPGDHILTVQALNKGGQVIATRRTVICVQKEWYQETTFLLLCFLAFLSLLLSGIYAIVQYTKNRARKKEEIQTRIKESENLALRSQMNPHFIFNTLNSINHHIMKADLDNASFYLQKFSKLIRSTLDLTRLEKVVLERELENLNLYMEIEQSRTMFSFEYQIIVNENVDAGFIMVPPLIIQPFVENAIWHGIKALPHPGNICIELEQVSVDILLIRITDNGIGRKPGTPEKKIHKSHGMQITADRLKIWNRKSYFTVTDLKDEKGTPSGTRVNIYLHY